MYQYEDNAAIAISSPTPKTLERKLNENLSSLAKWFVKNKLSLNSSKCKYFIFGTQHQINTIGDITVNFEGIELETTEQI